MYYCMNRVVNGEQLFRDCNKEILREIIRQVSDFSGVEVLTYCVLSIHFYVLIRVMGDPIVSDAELMRRFRVLCPKPTKYQAESAKVMESKLYSGGEEADAIRRKLLARMSDVSEFIKAVKPRFCLL